MKWFYTALLCLLGSNTAATVDAWPALYDVAGVTANDTLNIRQSPSPNADIVSTLSADAANIEMITLNDAETWGLVNIGEQRGWVSMRYMERHPNQFEGEFPAITSCYGTEPFWSLDLAGETLTFSSLDGENFITHVSPYSSANRIDRFALSARDVTGVIQVRSCSDGMSGRAFGLSIDLLVPHNAQKTLLSGCCTIQEN